MKSKNIAFGGVVGAVSLLFLYLASVVPSGKLTMLAVASCAIGVCICAISLKYAMVVYLAVSSLGLLFVPDKTMAVAFALFFGNYPFIKLCIEKLDKIFLEWVVKIAAFNAYVILGYFITKLFLKTVFPSDFSFVVVMLVINAAFVIYDIAFNILVNKIIELRREKNI